MPVFDEHRAKYLLGRYWAGLALRFAGPAVALFGALSAWRLSVFGRYWPLVVAWILCCAVAALARRESYLGWLRRMHAYGHPVRANVRAKSALPRLLPFIVAEFVGRSCKKEVVACYALPHQAMALQEGREVALIDGRELGACGWVPEFAVCLAFWEPCNVGAESAQAGRAPATSGATDACQGAARETEAALSRIIGTADMRMTRVMAGWYILAGAACLVLLAMSASGLGFLAAAGLSLGLFAAGGLAVWWAARRVLMKKARDAVDRLLGGIGEGRGRAMEAICRRPAPTRWWEQVVRSVGKDLRRGTGETQSES